MKNRLGNGDTRLVKLLLLITRESLSISFWCCNWLFPSFIDVLEPKSMGTIKCRNLCRCQKYDEKVKFHVHFLSLSLSLANFLLSILLSFCLSLLMFHSSKPPRDNAGRLCVFWTLPWGELIILTKVNRHFPSPESRNYF